MLAGHRRRAGVHEHEAPGTVGVFGLAGREASLAKSGGLLVARDTGDLDRGTKQRDIGFANNATAGHHVGQNSGRDIEQAQQGSVPLQGVDIEKQCARGIAGIGDMRGTASEVPDQPAVDRAEGQLTALSPRACAGGVVQQPFQFGAGKIGIQHQAGFFLDHAGFAQAAQRIAACCRAAVLPDDGGGQRLAGFTIPQHRGFALVGDADGVHIGGGNAVFFEHLGGYCQLGAPDLAGIMFYPTRLGKMLAELLLRSAFDLTCTIKQDGSRTGGALVKREDVLH